MPSSRSAAGRCARMPTAAGGASFPPRDLSRSSSSVRSGRSSRAATMVVAVGGGGIPVVARDGRHDGVDAVIDKDHASALLAIELGAERFVILTQVPTVYTGFGTDEQQAVEELVPGRDDGLIDSLPAGSMRPKVEAAFRFVRETGGEALITSSDGARGRGPGHPRRRARLGCPRDLGAAQGAGLPARERLGRGRADQRPRPRRPAESAPARARRAPPPRGQVARDDLPEAVDEDARQLRGGDVPAGRHRALPRGRRPAARARRDDRGHGHRSLPLPRRDHDPHLRAGRRGRARRRRGHPGHQRAHRRLPSVPGARRRDDDQGAARRVRRRARRISR